jgi:hypothetical protein
MPAISDPETMNTDSCPASGRRGELSEEERINLRTLLTILERLFYNEPYQPTHHCFRRRLICLFTPLSMF